MKYSPIIICILFIFMITDDCAMIELKIISDQIIIISNIHSELEFSLSAGFLTFR